MTKVKSVLLLIGAILFSAITVSAKEAVLAQERKSVQPEFMSAWTPLKLTILPPLSIPWGEKWSVSGLDIGLWTKTDRVDGLQIAFINTADYCRGLQIGGINVTRKMYGVQIGFLNIIEDNDIPFLPVLNAYF